MVDLDFQLPVHIDPFAEAEDTGSEAQEKVHIRVQQRNGRKSLTTIQGLKGDKADEKKTKVKKVKDNGNEKTENGLNTEEADEENEQVLKTDKVSGKTEKGSKTDKVSGKTDKAVGGTAGYDKILKLFKKEFCCNGTVVKDKELGIVIQLQGDQRKNVANLLAKAGIVKKELIQIHGF